MKCLELCFCIETIKETTSLLREETSYSSSYTWKKSEFKSHKNTVAQFSTLWGFSAAA